MKGRFHLLRESEISAVSQDKQSAMPAVNASSENLQNLMAYLSGLTGVKPGTAEVMEPSESAGISFSRILHPRPGDWLATFHEPGQTFEEYLNSNPTLPTAERNKIYVLPLGDLPRRRGRSLILPPHISACFTIWTWI